MTENDSIPISFVWRLYDHYRKQFEYSLYESDGEETNEMRIRMDTLMELIRGYRESH